MNNKPKFPIRQHEIEFGVGKDELWASAKIPAQDRKVWRDVFERFYGSSAPGSATWPDRSERLHSYGWTPADLDRAIASQGRSLPLPMDRERPFEDALTREIAMSEEQVESAAALAWEVMTFMDYARFTSTYARDRYLRELSRAGWSHSQLGALFGLTKQRVQQLLK